MSKSYFGVCYPKSSLSSAGVYENSYSDKQTGQLRLLCGMKIKENGIF